ncbi:hypothetical protein [Syntrophomonas palmitatica]|uniref:hypothetical protein n=1 Tax=Syntrophomonas palmitatica TaxID=402877 RepID=UPI0006D0A28A|nr:hypothetical protein [Syntrophomonas palmitatica]
MRKKNLVSILLCTFLLVTAAGCTNNSSKTTKEALAQTKTKASASKSAANVKQDVASKKQGQTPASKNVPPTGKENNGSRLMGKVLSINDSTLTLAVAQRPQRGEAASLPGSVNQKPPQDQGKNSTLDPGQPGSPQVTSETKSISIPSTAKILSGFRDSTKEIALSDIKTGDMVEITFSSTGDNKVEQVRVMTMPSGGQGQGGPGGPPPGPGTDKKAEPGT